MSATKLAFRSLWKTPAVSAIAILSLALGIGANSAIFSMVESILLRSLPVQEPGRLVNLCSTGPISGSVSQGNPGSCVFSYPMLRDLEQVPDVFESVAGYRSFGANLAYRGDTLSIQASSVSGKYFPALRMQPALGRLFDDQDDTTPGAHSVAVLAHSYWTERFAADPSVLNESLVINGVPLTIIGVAAPEFKGTTLGNDPEVFVPLSMRERLVPGWEGFDDRKSYWVYSFARLADGISQDRAQTVANQHYRQIIQDVDLPLQSSASESYLERFAEKTLELAPGNRGQSSMLEGSKVPLLLLLGVTGFVLLIACANVANLLLTKAISRSGEIALRMSLGATRSRVVLQLLAESVALAVLGGILGLGVAKLMLRLLMAMVPTGDGGPPISFELAGLTWVFLGVLTLVTSLVGLFPALKATRPDLAVAMKSQSSKATGTRSVVRFRMALAVGQISLSMALLVGAGLFIRSMLNVANVDLGIETENLAVFTVAPELNGYAPTDSRSFFRRVEEDIAVLPGVTAITASMVPLLGGSSWGTNVEVDGYEATPDEDTNAKYTEIGTKYFSTLGTPLIAGREFSVADELETPKVAIVNETFARRFNLGREAVGRFMQVGGGDENDIEIVGLVQDAKYNSVKGEIPPMFYMPYRQNDSLGFLYFYVLTKGDPASMLDTLRTTVQRLDPNLPVENMQTMESQIKGDVFIDSLLSQLSAGFAILATLLAAVGLYGTLAYSVAQRSGEIGLRMALGADARRVQRMILRQVGLLTGVGVVIGLGAAFGLGKAASSLLYELKGHDPAVFLGAGALLVVVALGAGMVPAFRASRIDPMVALRDD